MHRTRNQFFCLTPDLLVRGQEKAPRWRLAPDGSKWDRFPAIASLPINSCVSHSDLRIPRLSVLPSLYNARTGARIDPERL
jgi:hypothetical protein